MVFSGVSELILGRGILLIDFYYLFVLCFYDYWLLCCELFLATLSFGKVGIVHSQEKPSSLRAFPESALQRHMWGIPTETQFPWRDWGAPTLGHLMGLEKKQESLEQTHPSLFTILGRGEKQQVITKAVNHGQGRLGKRERQFKEGGKMLACMWLDYFSGRPVQKRGPGSLDPYFRRKGCTPFLYFR